MTREDGVAALLPYRGCHVGAGGFLLLGDEVGHVGRCHGTHHLEAFGWLAPGGRGRLARLRCRCALPGTGRDLKRSFSRRQHLPVASAQLRAKQIAPLAERLLGKRQAYDAGRWRPLPLRYLFAACVEQGECQRLGLWLFLAQNDLNWHSRLIPPDRVAHRPHLKRRRHRQLQANVVEELDGRHRVRAYCAVQIHPADLPVSNRA